MKKFFKNAVWYVLFFVGILLLAYLGKSYIGNVINNSYEKNSLKNDERVIIDLNSGEVNVSYNRKDEDERNDYKESDEQFIQENESVEQENIIIDKAEIEENAEGTDIFTESQSIDQDSSKKDQNIADIKKIDDSRNTISQDIDDKNKDSQNIEDQINDDESQDENAELLAKIAALEKKLETNNNISKEELLKKPTEATDDAVNNVSDKNESKIKLFQNKEQSKENVKSDQQVSISDENKQLLPPDSKKSSNNNIADNNVEFSKPVESLLDKAKNASKINSNIPSLSNNSLKKIGKISLIVTDLGLSNVVTDQAMNSLPSNVTLGFSIYASDLDKLVQKAKKKGHDVLLHLPMEPIDYPMNDPGPLALLINNPVEQNIKRFNWMLNQAEDFAGFYTSNQERFSFAMSAMEV
ncbi:MAG: divergent polysaccharide deacetylase family protein, partial [Pseudomonadota bacterium]